MEALLCSDFQNAVSVFQENDVCARPLVNYVWINACPFDADQDVQGRLCGVPMEYLDLAVQNANLYPDADFILWIDRKMVDASTCFWLDSFLYAMGRHGNISVGNLRDIPAYAGNLVFDRVRCEDGFLRSGVGGVYVRADFARVVVLDHIRQTQSYRRFVIYSDMDCPNVQLNWAVGAAMGWGCSRHDGRSYISHGYIGLDMQHPQVIEHFSNFVIHARRLAQGGSLGVSAFRSFIDAVYRRSDFYNVTDSAMALLPPVKHKPHSPDWIRDLGVS